MSQRAQLITPKGKKIELPPEVYRQIRQLLKRRAPRSRAHINHTLHETYGKYAHATSLTRLLILEHETERIREATKLNQMRG